MTGIGKEKTVLRIKRAYEPPGPEDGERILVDRLWPRGLTREKARIRAWLKDLAPGADLRRWFAHDPARWEEFRARFERELASPERQSALRDLAGRSRRGTVTLVFGARDEARNNAVVLKELIEAIARRAARER